MSEWLRYTDVGAASPLLKNAAYVMEWMRNPKRIESWRMFDKAKAGKSWPPAIRPAKKRDAVLAVLMEYQHLLTEDGEHFRINPHAETAVTPQLRSFATAEDLRRTAGKVGLSEHPESIRKSPQISATGNPRG